MDLDDEWDTFMKTDKLAVNDEVEPEIDNEKNEGEVPVCNDLYISTKTKVLYLNIPIDINSVFWNIPVIEYWKPTEGVIKKQIKIVNNSKEEYNDYLEKLNSLSYYTENIIKQVDNQSARKVKFKDERKLTVGVSKKDIMSYRSKKKNAFYNCFAIIVRFYQDNEFKEIHVKVFNTGKMEIPGILNAKMLELIQIKIIEILQPLHSEPISYVENNEQGEQNVLINSNFSCGYYVDREKLHTILRSEKYGIESAYDPCSYPGVKCKYYFNNELSSLEEQTGKVSNEDNTLKLSELSDNNRYTEVSFMIFRTGSCLIVGNCSETILLHVFDFIKSVFTNEYYNIRAINQEETVKEKKKKVRKRNVFMTEEYHKSVLSSAFNPKLHILSKFRLGV
jgi:hypothetical protein